MNNAAQDYLREQFTAHELTASAEQLNNILAWLNLLDRWARVHNLTGVRGMTQRIDTLVLDSLAARAFLRPTSILDIGSGAGVPGIPLAIFAPENRYTLIDGSGKKAQFIKRCAEELALTNVVALHARAEQHHAETYDTIIARSVGTIDQVLKYSMHLAKSNTRWIIFKPARPRDEPPINDKIWHIQREIAPLRRASLSLALVEARHPPKPHGQHPPRSGKGRQRHRNAHHDKARP